MKLKKSKNLLSDDFTRLNKIIIFGLLKTKNIHSKIQNNENLGIELIDEENTT